jgi:hypothetical protein
VRGKGADRTLCGEDIDKDSGSQEDGSNAHDVTTLERLVLYVKA